MKKYIFFLCLVCFAQILHAQFGLNVSYKQIDASGWDNNIEAFTAINGETQTTFDNGLSYGIDYWFRLKKKRIEFMPELNYAGFSETWSNSESTVAEISTNFLSLYANTNIYLFDLGSDCNCPTFDKDGDILKKGFFFQISPGVSYVSNNFSNKVSNNDVGQNTFAPSIGLGVGLDIGVSKFLTITPIVTYRQHFNVNWENMHDLLESNPILTGEDDETEVSMLSFGIRIGMRFDELKNKYGYR